MGTIFCHHRNESEVYGSNPVPCPLCGMDAGDDGAEQGPTAGAEDANDALRHALFEDPSSGSGSELSVVW